ncbi:hypothetical protein ACRQU7_17710 [Caproiciproducens sp. R1]|jgi:hypothetical protein|uniref:hypothetical protein n=1 Tax=Caproiciproducens sp. R1 TaxID=3435000 RepID=UPI004033EAEF
MTFFTDSPFERMMVQKPQYRREERPLAPPKSQLDRSRDCYRDLIITPKRKENEKCGL